jgi:hypothetical protein
VYAGAAALYQGEVMYHRANSLHITLLTFSMHRVLNGSGALHYVVQCYAVWHAVAVELTQRRSMAGKW